MLENAKSQNAAKYMLSIESVEKIRSIVVRLVEVQNDKGDLEPREQGED